MVINRLNHRLTLSRRVSGQNNAGRNCATQSRMCSAKDSRGYLSVRSSTRCILSANCSTDSPLSTTRSMRNSSRSKRLSVLNNSMRKTKEPDLVRLSTRSPEREGMTAKIPAVGEGADAGAMCGGRGDCGREEEDGREEGAAGPLECLRAFLPVAGDDDVALVL